MIWAPSLSWNATVFPRSRLWPQPLALSADPRQGRTLLVLDQQEQLMGYLCLLEHRGWDRLIIQTRHPLDHPPAGWAPPAGAGDPGGQRGRLGAIRLEVGDANEGAGPLSRAGFRPRQKLPDYYGHGQHAHRLVLALKQA